MARIVQIPHRGLHRLLTSKRKHYSERCLLGYSMEQMFEVVSDVDRYKEFVPWCTDSKVINKGGRCLAELEVGFPPLTERYTSLLTLSRPHLVKSVSVDSNLFNYLITVWQFSPAPNRDSAACTLNFSVAFEFQSLLHANLAHVFFDEVVKTMVSSFLSRAKDIYGRPSLLQ